MAAYRRIDGLVTCGLIACTLGSTPGPTLGNKNERTLSVPFYFVVTMFLCIRES